MKSSKQKDHIIASYLVEHSEVPQTIRERAINQLSEVANGLAILLQLAVEYLGMTPRPQSKKGLQDTLKRLSSCQSTATLYLELFDKTRSESSCSTSV